MDLFEDDKTQMNKKMLIHENKNDGIYVEGLNEVEATDIEHCLELMQRGERNRIVRQTHMNVKSSRSHTIFQLLIEEVFPSSKSYRVPIISLRGSKLTYAIWLAQKRSTSPRKWNNSTSRNSRISISL